MSRRRTPKKRILLSDPVYDNRLIEMIINRLMKQGKKALASRLVYQVMKQVAENTQQDPVKVVEQAVRNATPLVEVKARRVGGSTYQVPIEVDAERGTALALRWIISSCRMRSGKTMVLKLTNEILDASKNIGNAVRKRDEIHKMAEANKAFAKYRF
jgi:small subunit ribosomal protein S7